MLPIRIQDPLEYYVQILFEPWLKWHLKIMWRSNLSLSLSLKLHAASDLYCNQSSQPFHVPTFLNMEYCGFLRNYTLFWSRSCFSSLGDVYSSHELFICKYFSDPNSSFIWGSSGKYLPFLNQRLLYNTLILGLGLF